MIRTPLPAALLASVAASLLACSGDAPEVEAPAPAPTVPGAPSFDAATLPHAQLPGSVVPEGYRIDMVIDPDADTMSGVVEIDVDVLDPVESFFIHAKDMDISSATLTSGTQAVELRADVVPPELAPSGLARLLADAALPRGDGTLRLEYTTPYNLALNSAYKVVRETDAGVDSYIVTQMEPIGAREAFPGFDEPRFKVPFTVSITAPEDDVVFFNTPRTGETPVEGGMVRHEFQTTRPLPTYLIAFGVGPYDVVEAPDIPPNAVRERSIALRGFTARGSGEEIEYGLAGTEPILAALENYFGSEYPYEKLDIIAAPDYAFGAMENPGAIVYREFLMLLDADAPLSQIRAYNGVHSHELAHQWFGNLVTPEWWEDIWLNEAFATWMGNKGTALAYPEGGYELNTLQAALQTMNTDSLASTRRIREPLERSENVMDQFDGITYRKGGGVLSMFESFVGEEAFRDGVRLHMERYADGVASADDFFQSIADGSGNPDVVSAMKSFVDQPGVPLVRGEVSCEGDEDGSGPVTVAVDLAQSRFAPLGSTIGQGQSWQIPVCMAYGLDGEEGAEGERAESGRMEECTLLEGTSARVELAAPSCPAWVTLNADGAGYYRFTLDTESWAALLANIDQLTTAEVLTVQDSLGAAMQAGEVEPATYLAGLETFATHPDYDVASKTGDLLGFIYGEFPEAHESTARLIQSMYAERYAANLGQSTPEGELLVPALAANLVRRGADAALAEEYAGLGAAYLAGERGGVAPNLAGLALSEAAIADPQSSVEPLMALVRSGSALEKGLAVNALGSIRDAELAAEVRERAMTDTATFTGRQALSLVGAQMRNPATADATWAWVRENFPALVARTPDVRKPGLPGLVSGLCSGEERDAAEAFFTDNAALIPGYERSLAQTLERIELCAALKAGVGERLVAALRERSEVEE